MHISPTITRRALLGLLSAFVLLPLAGCDTEADANTKPGHDADERPLESNELLIPSDHSPFTQNAAWCAPMQICWNLLEEDFNDGDPIPEDGHPEMVSDLNNGSFTTEFLGEDHYVTYVGKATTDAKEEIETLLKQRFDQTSDILDLVTWSDDPLTAAFILYCMLYREFTFESVFDVLDPAPFGTEEGGNLTENVEYFGCDENSKPTLFDQVTPLFWESDDRFAVRIKCQEGDLLYLARGAQGSTFDEVWNDIKSSINPDYEAGMTLVEAFACPKLNVDIINEYTDLAGVSFTNAEGENFSIGQALQTLRFELDEKGGAIKSEALISVYGGMIEIAAHDYLFNDSFVLFLVDGTIANLYPYAGLYVQDIKDFI